MKKAIALQISKKLIPSVLRKELLVLIRCDYFLWSVIIYFNKKVRRYYYIILINGTNIFIFNPHLILERKLYKLIYYNV